MVRSALDEEWTEVGEAPREGLNQADSEDGRYWARTSAPGPLFSVRATLWIVRVSGEYDRRRLLAAGAARSGLRFISGNLLVGSVGRVMRGESSRPTYASVEILPQTVKVPCPHRAGNGGTLVNSNVLL